MDDTGNHTVIEFLALSLMNDVNMSYTQVFITTRESGLRLRVYPAFHHTRRMH